MKNKLILVALFAFLTLPALADPITKEDARAWVQRALRIDGKPRDFDLEGATRSRVVQIRAELRNRPRSKVLKRDLGDALHTLGHFAEHAHDYKTSLRLHAESLDSYLASGLESLASWDDGVDHAREHIFIGLYDQAVLFSRNGRSEEANEFFENAWHWATSWNLHNKRLSDQFAPRFFGLQNGIQRGPVRPAGFSRHLRDKLLRDIQCGATF